ncbi:tubulin--tyrosine ligase-like protein 12 [Argonauta hians]
MNGLTDTVITPDNIDFETFKHLHVPQLQFIPDRFWDTLFQKLKGQVFDAGATFQILKIDYSDADDDADEEEEGEEHEEEEDRKRKEKERGRPQWKVVALSDISAEDERQVYLVDHAWTYDVKDARKQLREVPGLSERMASLMDISVGAEETPTSDRIVQKILDTMWLYNQVYSFGNERLGSEGALPLWYIMDEFGSRIGHSNDPSFCVVPFYYVLHQMCYSVIFPLKDIQSDDEVTRNYLHKECTGLERDSRLSPWIHTDFTDIDYIPNEPEDKYFYEHRSECHLPGENEQPLEVKGKVLKVYMDYDTMDGHLSDPRFTLVEDRESADILFIKDNIHNYKNLHRYVNQFPNESIVTVKDLLAVTCRRYGLDRSTQGSSLEYGPSWLPVTYNLNTELPQFVSYFQHRQKRNLNNLWICKPWNMARALDSHITDQLPYIVRLRESGPKVACKYVEDPLLMHFDGVGGVKFDIRYIVLLRSVRPLKLYAYKCFFLRFCNIEYSLDSFDVYEKHFTVMNYDDNIALRQVNYDEFIPMFNRQYPEQSWDDVERDIFKMFRGVFQAATLEPYPRGIPHSPQSRAMYAIDFLLKWGTDDKGSKTIVPVICEVNFVPDCHRANQFHPSFTNDVFSCLFLDDIENRPIIEI